METGGKIFVGHLRNMPMYHEDDIIYPEKVFYLNMYTCMYPAQFFILQTEHAWTVCEEFDLDRGQWLVRREVTLCVPAVRQTSSNKTRWTKMNISLQTA